MLDKLIRGGYGPGYGRNDNRSSGYGFEEHKEFVSHDESGRGYFDRQFLYDHHERRPANYGRPPMAHMPVCDEEEPELDVDEFYKSTRSLHTTMLPHHSNNHHQQAPHMNFVSPPPMGQPHHNGKMGNGWQGRHEDAYHGEHGMQHNGGHGMKQQDRLMAPQVPPHHVYMNPNHGSGSGNENWRVGNGGGHHKVGWGSKGL